FVVYTDSLCIELVVQGCYDTQSAALTALKNSDVSSDSKKTSCNAINTAISACDDLYNNCNSAGSTTNSKRSNAKAKFAETCA
ncbi:hypothetical protein BaRGS_00017972, partial [Batillaria attramentaria]